MIHKNIHSRSIGKIMGSDEKSGRKYANMDN